MTALTLVGISYDGEPKKLSDIIVHPGNQYTMKSTFARWCPSGLAIAFFTLSVSFSSPFFGHNVAMADDPRPMQLNDLYQFGRIAEPQLSPDGTQVVYQLTRITDAAKNQKNTQLWLVKADGSDARQLTYSGKSDTHPRWSPDGSKILFESNRDGSSQLYVMDLKIGGEPHKVTSISSGASGGTWAPDGKHIAFVSAIYPEYSELPFAESDAKNAAQDEAIASSPVKAKTFTKLFYRHWDSYVEGKRQHIFVIDADGKNCRDVTPGDRDAYPTSSTFSSGDDFTFSPDGKHIVFTAVPKVGESWSTNHDICRVSIDNKSTDWESMTSNNPAADCYPKLSPSGKRVAYRTQARPGYEADKWNLVIRDCAPDGSFSGQPKVLTADLDRSVGDYAWTDENNLIFTADDGGSSSVFAVGMNSKPTKTPLDMGDNRAGQITALSVRGEKVALARSTMNEPAQLFVTSLSTKVAKPITTHNAELLNAIAKTKPESVTVKVEGETPMQMWILKPPGFDAKKKWPVVYLIHGGPQGAWEDGWSFRWNPQTWAAQGYVIVMPNPRGSTGFGQLFCDEISGDWGGKCYRDLVAGLAHVKSLPYVDSDRIASAGASFGGYMQDWFAVNEIATNFKCLITHCSVYNFESMWGTTDELWFDEFEHGGLPWEIPGKYREFSPHTLAGNLGKYRVPMLIIHNDLDFRCPIGQGHELFNALQRQGVPSRFVNFPDEGHWVNKSANALHWHKEVFGWLEKYCPHGGK